MAKSRQQVTSPPRDTGPSGATWRTPRFAQEGAFRFSVVAIALGFLTLGSILVDGVSNDSGLPLAVYAGVGSVVMAVGVFLAAGFVVNRTCQQRSLTRTVFTLVIFAATEITRTVVFTVILLRYDVTLDLMLAHRFLAGGLTGMLVLGIVSLIVNDRRAYVSEYRDLATRQFELARELAHLNHTIDEFMDTLRENVRQSVEAALRPILDTLVGRFSTKDVVTDIVRVSEDVVRPLSEQVAQALPENPEQPPVRPSVTPRQLFHLTTVTQPFQPVAMPVIVFLLFFSASLFLVRYPQGVVLLAVTMLLVWASHFLGNRYVQSRLTTWRMAVRVLVVSALYVGGIAAGIVWIMVSVDTANVLGRSPTVFYMVAFFLFMSWGLAIVPAVRAARQQILQDLVATSSDLAQARARAEVRLRREKQRLAGTVHGDIQSTLMATALRLQHPGCERSDVPAILAEAQQKIRDSLHRVEHDQIPATLPAVKDAVDSFWLGMLTITWESNSAVAKRIAHDSELAEVVWQVVREAAGNAIKHGQATDLEVTLRLDTPSTHLQVVMSDNGKPSTGKLRTGGGTRLFQAVSKHVDIRQMEGRTVVSLTIPLASVTQLAPVL